MKIDKDRLSEIGAGILVLCAVVTTILVVRREFVPDSMATAPTIAQSQPRFIDGWEDVLTVGIRSGAADAPVQVIEFTDFQCPYCAHFEETVKTIRDRYPDQVAFTFAPFPLDFHEFAEAAQRAAECAHNQGKFDAIRSLLFEKQQAFGADSWTDFAMQSGIVDISQFEACVNDTKPLERIEHSKKLADKFGVKGTPTVLVNGWMLPAPPSPENFDKIVQNTAEGRPATTDVNFYATNAQN